MTIQEFKRQIKRYDGLSVRKQYRLEAFDVIHHGTELFSVSFAKIQRISNMHQFLTDNLRPEYIPPLG